MKTGFMFRHKMLETAQALLSAAPCVTEALTYWRDFSLSDNIVIFRGKKRQENPKMLTVRLTVPPPPLGSA